MPNHKSLLYNFPIRNEDVTFYHSLKCWKAMIKMMSNMFNQIVEIIYGYKKKIALQLTLKSSLHLDEKIK